MAQTEETVGPYHNTTMTTATRAGDEKAIVGYGSSKTIVHKSGGQNGQLAQNRYSTLYSGNDNYGETVQSSSKLGNKPS